MTRPKLLIPIVLTAVVALIIWGKHVLNHQCISSEVKTNLNGDKIFRHVTNNILMKDTSYEKQFSLTKDIDFSVKDFFSTDLVEHPEEANKLSPLLTTRQDIIDESQRIHMNIFRSLFGGYKYAMLFDYTPSENKGDSAIAVGEIILLRKLNIEIIFACAVNTCSPRKIDKAQYISQKYSDKELVILFHGGGNVIGWNQIDLMRAKEIPRFMRFNIIMFPQGILYTGPQSHIDFCKKLYASHRRLTFIWRDMHSFRLGKELFPKVRSLLSPDIAYQISHVPRFMNPTHDIIWIKRTDKEASNYTQPNNSKGYRLHISDWLGWKSPSGTSPMENIFLMTTTGMMFLQRGRVVITDRLHGHILSTLLGIPHIFIDNAQRKISNYHNTWTAGVKNIVRANSSEDALDLARDMLIKLDNELPRVKAYFPNKTE